MTKPTAISNTESVAALIEKLEPSVAEIVSAIRKIILSTDPEIGEQIKWNSPCFFYTGEMKAFDPKEYKRDIAVLNLHKGRIMLVLPTGATIKNTFGILEGNFKDTRKIIAFKDLADVVEKENALQSVI